MVDTSGRIPEEFIQALLNRVDIVELIGSYVSLRKAGANFVACCPFHNEKTPSFSVNQTKQFYHCFGCGVSGDAIQFLIEHKALTFVEAVEQLAGQVGMQMPTLDKDPQSKEYNLIYTILNDASKFFEQQLRQQEVAQHAVKYLKDRGITGLTAKNFGLGFAPPGWDNLLNGVAKTSEDKDIGVKAGLFVQRDANKYYDRFRNRIMFPIRNRRGKVIGFGGRVIDKKDEPKYLNSPETVLFNKSQELYGFYEARTSIQQQKFVLVVEGYMDVVSVAQAGITNVVATLGTACTEQHIQFLFKTTPEIVFCFDGDVAGKKAAWRSLELCLPLLDDQHRIKFLILKNNEDPDSFVRKFGAEALQTEIKRAASLPDFLFATLSKQVDLQHIDGRVQYANQVKQYLQKMPAGLLQAMLFDRLGRIIDVDPDMLQGKTKSAPSSRRAELTQTIVTKRKSVKSIGLISPAMRALALLLEDRTLLNQVPDLTNLASLDIAGSALFCAVCDILRNNPLATEDQIMAALPTDLEHNFDIAQLRGIARIVPIAGLTQEFLGALALLRRREKDLILDDLLLKAKENVLSPEDKLLLQQMLQEKGKTTD